MSDDKAKKDFVKKQKAIKKLEHDKQKKKRSVKNTESTKVNTKTKIVFQKDKKKELKDFENELKKEDIYEINLTDIIKSRKEKKEEIIRKNQEYFKNYQENKQNIKKNTNRKEKFLSSIYKQCVQDYYIKPWIKAYSGIFYVNGLVNNMEIQNYDNQYVNMSDSIDYNGETYYKGKRSLDTIICSGSNKKQVDDYLEFNDKDNNFFSIKILYKQISIGKQPILYIKQTSNIFKLENEWLIENNLSVNGKIDRILSQKIIDSMYFEEIQYICFSNLKKYVNSEDAKNFIQKTTDNIKNENETVKKFLFDIGKLLIFLDIDYMGEDAEKFRKQFASKMYNTKDLTLITPKQILRDMYLTIPFEIITTKINNNLENYAYKTVKNIFSIERVETELQNSILSLNKNNNFDTISCNNSINSSDWDTILYKENGTLYCFKLYNLIEQFSKDNYINEYTQNKFTQDFIDDINSYNIYNIPEEQNENISKINNLPQQIFFEKLNNLELDLLSNTKPGVCKYYKKYCLNINSDLEKKLNKTEDMIEKIKKRCDIKLNFSNKNDTKDTSSITMSNTHDEEDSDEDDSDEDDSDEDDSDEDDSDEDDSDEDDSDEDKN